MHRCQWWVPSALWPSGVTLAARGPSPTTQSTTEGTSVPGLLGILVSPWLVRWCRMRGLPRFKCSPAPHLVPHLQVHSQAALQSASGLAPLGLFVPHRPTNVTNQLRRSAPMPRTGPGFPGIPGTQGYWAKLVQNPAPPGLKRFEPQTRLVSNALEPKPAWSQTL